MGILCDLFVATPEMASKYEAMLESEEPRDSFVREEWKGVTQLEFEILWAMLDGRDWDPELHLLEKVEAGESTWLFRFPAAFAKELGALSRDRIKTLAAAWAAIEELQWPAEEAEEVIVSAVRLARQAAAADRGLYLWGSL
jgi:hypothetical protein